MKLLLLIPCSFLLTMCAATDQIGSVNGQFSYTDKAGQTYAGGVGVTLRDPKGLRK